MNYTNKKRGNMTVWVMLTLVVLGAIAWALIAKKKAPTTSPTLPPVTEKNSDELVDALMGTPTTPAAMDKFVAYAKELGLDTEKFKQDLDSQAVLDKVRADLKSGIALNVEGTPTMFANGQPVSFTANLKDDIEKIIDEAKKADKKYQPSGEYVIKDNENSKGNKQGVVTVIEYGDLQCPPCGALYTELKKIFADNKDEMQVVFRNFPLPMHPHAVLAARAVQAAALQGKFWEMHDKIFSTQKDWSKIPAVKPEKSSKEEQAQPQESDTDTTQADKATDKDKDKDDSATAKDEQTTAQDKPQQ